MDLNESQIAKIDPLLEEVLTYARGNEEIRAIITLGADNQIKKDASNPPLDPNEFPSYQAYRQALIERRKNQLAEAVGDTVQALQNLSLKPIGGTLSRVVVVEGSANAILSSLDLPGVNHVSLDQLIALPEIAPDEAVKHFADLYINILDRPLDEKTKKLIYKASQQYIINYHKRHNKLQILGMQKPVDLDSIYTAVQCFQNYDIRKFESVEGLEELYRQAGKRGIQHKKANTEDGLKVANQQQYLMVLGAPGAGKSTLLRKIGLEALKAHQSEYQHQCIPLFIDLKQFTDKEINIHQTIVKDFFDCQLPLIEDFTTKALEQGKLLILLDGLDEVPTDNMDLAIKQIQSFVDEWKKNRFIISCRIAAYRQNFPKCSEVTIAEFNDGQIQQFIKNWFSSEVDKKVETAEKFWGLLKQQEYTATKELAQTPLLLTFLCLVYDESQDLPKNRSTLYSDALDILLRRWRAEKRIQEDRIDQELGIDLEKIMLSEIAYLGFEAEKLFFSHQEVVREIKEFLASNDNAPKHLEAEVVLDAIAIQQGILVERERDIYSFSHLTLQEYLTAKYIDDHQLIEKLVAEHLTDERWKEVFLLVAGLMRGGADKLLLLMEKEAQKYIKTRKFPNLFRTSKLQALLHWAEQITDGSEGNFKPVGKRAAAIAIAIANAYAIAIVNSNPNGYAIAYAIGIANADDIAKAKANANAKAYAIAIANAKAYAIANTYAIAIAKAKANAIAKDIAKDIANANAIAKAIDKFINLATELDQIKIFKPVNFTVLIARLKELKAQIPYNNQFQQVHRQFVDRLIQTWLNAFNLTPEMVDLSAEELQALDNYLYANYLIIQCKQAAVRVSPQTWEAIEARMLLVPTG
ncbi:NACHT domain-containing protein [Scytonema hofmannii FACHB-248]|uniref:NACHT domain-containing protein n=1 Tax=Scytonema hofmannii FACHB-248 TaxID=1842502 RepID=A0ABR8GIW3_9CYAN|nr:MULTISPECIES: NACHT domain-containing protein [Nostocales]MBD2603113.1 NACHT domain-containing protein [Scytonema hofmannii FACHB-248]